MTKRGSWSGWLAILLSVATMPLAWSSPPATDPQVSTVDYPGLITLRVDASDVSQRIQRVTETIPVQPGRLTLWYPQWIPGNHAPTGPIHQIAGLIIHANGATLSWQRDPLNMYAFEVDVPRGVQQLEIQFQYL